MYKVKCMLYLIIQKGNKIVLSSDDTMRLKTFEGIPSYRLGTNSAKLYETELI